MFFFFFLWGGGGSLHDDTEYAHTFLISIKVGLHGDTCLMTCVMQ